MSPLERLTTTFSPDSSEKQCWNPTAVNQKNSPITFNHRSSTRNLNPLQTSIVPLLSSPPDSIAPTSPLDHWSSCIVRCSFHSLVRVTLFSFHLMTSSASLWLVSKSLKECATYYVTTAVSVKLMVENMWPRSSAVCSTLSV